jgi:acyl-CoA synthetase (NDP forming)
MSPTECSRYRAWGVPVLMGTETALRALGHYARFHGAAAADKARRVIAASPPEVVPPRWRERLESAAAAGSTLQDLDLLCDFGLPVAQGLSAPDLQAALAFARRNGYPLVAKIDSPDVAHKSDLGGVILGITNDDALRAAFERLQAIAPGPVLLQQQLGGIELILGMKHDPQWGPTFTLGLGGIFVEILKDYVTLVPGDDDALIEAKIRSLATFPLLAGARGRVAADMRLLTAVVQRFMRMGLALQYGVQEMEVNPLLVDGTRIAAVDLLVIPKAPPPP